MDGVDIDVDDFIKPPPQAGSGVHQWLFGQACRLRSYGASPEEALEYIKASLDKHPPGRDVDERELNEAVRNAFAEEGERVNGPSWPKPKAKDIRAIVEKSGAFTLDGLRADSPADVEHRKAEKVIDTLFPGNPLLCLAVSKSNARTLEREQWRGCEENHQFIVSSHMTACSKRENISAMFGQRRGKEVSRGRIRHDPVFRVLATFARKLGREGTHFL
jgi:hypothetical protein